MLMAWMAFRRVAELRADRDAARVMGDIRPVVAGLTLLHGSTGDRRRLQRGELTGIILDARAEEVPQSKWGTWWRSAVGAAPLPPLQLRVAELAAWSESPEGERQLCKGSLVKQGWWSWAVSIWDR